MTKGFGVKLDGKILIRTVSDTEVAAKVNGLVLCFGVTPFNAWGAERINEVWEEALANQLGVHLSTDISIVPVIVTEEI